MNISENLLYSDECSELHNYSIYSVCQKEIIHNYTVTVVEKLDGSTI